MERVLNRIRSWQSSRYYATIVSLILGVLATGIFFVIWGLLIKETEHNYKETLTSQVNLVEKEMSKRFEILDIIAKMEELEDVEVSFKEKAAQINKKIRSEGLIRIGIADISGRAYAANGDSIDITEYAYFKKALQGQKAIQGPIISKRDGRNCMVYAQPIYQNNQVYGVLYAVYDFEYMNQIITKIIETPKMYTMILDAGFEKILSTGNETNIKEQKLGEIFVKELDQAMLDSSGYKVCDEEQVFWMTQSLPDAGWSVIRLDATQAIFMNINKVVSFIGLFLMVTIAFIYGRLKKKYEDTHKSIEETENLDNIMVLRINALGEVIYANKVARKNLEFSKEEILQKKIKDILVYEDQDPIAMLLCCKKNIVKIKSMALEFKTKEYKRLDTICTVKINDDIPDGQSIEISAVDVSQYHFINGDKEVVSNLYKLIASSEEEIQIHAKELMKKQDELEQSERQLRKMLYFDELTDMPNRNLLREKITTYLEQGDKFAIIMMDVDNFKFVNDSFGHDSGDEVLTSIGMKLNACFCDENIEKFRLGADEFAILMKGIDEQGEIEKLLIKVQGLFQEAFVLNDIKFYVYFSMGIAMAPKDGTSYNELMTNADTAMNYTKENGKRNYNFFNQQLKEVLLEKIRVENDLRRAIKNKEFILYYQPQTDIKTGRIKGFEALIRWIDPNGVMIPPSKFIDIAEESGLIIPIGKWVIEEGCRFINRLEKEGYHDLYVAVNVSVVQLVQGEFSETLQNIISETQVNPALLHIEITETILMESIEANIKTVEQIKAQGAHVSLDDFGKGYSSLTYLKKLPIDVLKIEKAFIDDILVDQEKNITSAIINLGHELNLEVVAEGVETIEQKEYLLEYGCDVIQGYLVSRPIPEDKIIDLLIEYNQ